VIVVKGHQPQLHYDIHRLLHDSYSLAEPMVAAETGDVSGTAASIRAA
jgi:hypothetical protein